MCGVLMASVLLASGVNAHLRGKLFVALGDSVIDGPVTFRMPVGWNVSEHAGDGDSTWHTAADPSGAGRSVTVIRQRVDRILAPVEYLHLSGQFAGATPESRSDAISLDGWPAQTLQWSLHTDNAETEILACSCVLPSAQAITVRIERTSGSLGLTDERLLQQMVQAMRCSETPAAGPALIDGAAFSAPSGYLLCPPTDPLRTDRTMLSQGSDGSWISIEIAPIWLNEPSLATLGSILASRQGLDMRDPLDAERWLAAEITQERPDLWKIDPRDPEDRAVHRRAYVLGGKGNLGVLVSLSVSASLNSEASLDNAWSLLQGRVQMTGTADLKPMMASAQQLLANAITPSTNDEQWWLWSHDGIPRGWTHCFTDVTDNTPVRQTIRYNWEGTAECIWQGWNLLAATNAHMSRSDCETDPDSQLQFFFATYNGFSNPLTTVIDLQNKRGSPFKMEKPSAFATSEQWPSLLQKPPAQPAAMWTDRFPGNEDDLLVGPLLLTIQQAASDSPDLTCSAVQIDGSGAMSRWYFNSSGALDHADFAGGWSLRPVPRAEIDSAVGSDRRLTVRGP